jgi:hypothetical protein
VDLQPTHEPSTALAPGGNPPAAPVPVRLYGFLWAGVYAGQQLQSYGLPTSTAPTSAINPALSGDPHHSTLSFQVQQTRVGMVLGEGTPFRGTLEVDFIHFDQSTPFAQAYPRIRVALLEWMFTKKQRVFLGQTWDIFGNATGPQLLSHSFNFVGSLFQAGNIGFMRPQLGWQGRFRSVELAAAAGMPANNITDAYSDVEKSNAPTGSVRAMFHVGDAGVIGLAGIYTKLRYTHPTTGSSDQHRNAAGGNVFADLTFGLLNLHAEGYVAQNLAGTGASNLGQGRWGHDVSDAGGYLSGKLTFGNHAITAMYGGAAVLHPSQVAPGYIPANPMTGTALTSNVGGPGMKYNMTGHVGYWWSPIKGLSIVAEPYVYCTKFALAAADVHRVDSKNVAWGGLFGSMYTF